MSSLKRYNPQSSQWEYVAIGKQGLTGPIGATGPVPDISGKANLTGGNTFTGNQNTDTSFASSGTTLNSRFSATSSLSGANDYLFLLSGANNTGNKAVHFVNSSNRTNDGGANSYTIRNDGGPLNLGNSSFTTTIFGRTLNPNQPAFYARGAEAGYTLTNQADIPFNNAEVNIGNHFNTSNFRFTAPVSGAYQINTSLFALGGGGRVSIKVNGGPRYNSQTNVDSAWCWSGTIYLNANDFVTVGDWQNTSGFVIYMGHSSFSGFLVG